MATLKVAIFVCSKRGNMIAIKPTKLKDFASLMQIEVLPEQKHAHLPFEQSYQQRSKYEVFLSLCVDQKAIGYLIIDKAFSFSSTFARRHELSLKYIVLDKAYQRKGLGRRVMQKLNIYANAISANSDSICVSIPATDDASQQFFLASGFVEERKLIYGKSGKERILRHRL